MEEEPLNLDEVEGSLESLAAGIEDGFEDEPQQSRNSLTRYKISTYGSDLEVELLVKRLNDKRYVIPDYQRGYVWTRKRASKFIESLLVGLPIPGIFLYKDGSQFLVIDGHQRLKTLQAFFDGIFPGTDRAFKLDGVAEEFDGKGYDQLDSADRAALNSAIIHASVIEQESPSEEEDASSIYLIFERINSGSVPLTPHEIRYCASYGKFAGAIKEWNGNQDWRSLVGKKNLRMKDQEIILRFIAMLEESEYYSAPMQGFLDQFLRINREVNDQQLEIWKRLFFETCRRINEASGANAFKRTNAINVAIAEAVLVATAQGLQQKDLTQDLGSKIQQLKADPEFKSATESSTSDQNQVATRLKRAREYLRNERGSTA